MLTSRICLSYCNRVLRGVVESSRRNSNISHCTYERLSLKSIGAIVADLTETKENVVGLLFDTDDSAACDRIRCLCLQKRLQQSETSSLKRFHSI